MEEARELAVVSEENVFLSWSGKRSKKLAYIFKKHLHLLVPGATGFLSEEDISKGKRGLSEIQGRLTNAKFGLVFLTPENRDASWIHFEAGALSNGLGEGMVSPVLYDMVPAELGASPLAQFQATELTKEDLGRLLRDIEKAVSPGVESRWAKYFEKFWPDMKVEIEDMPEAPNSSPKPTREMEMLAGISRQLISIRSVVSSPEKVLPESHLASVLAGLGSDEDISKKLRGVIDDLKSERDEKSGSLSSLSDAIDEVVWGLESVLETLSANNNIATEFKDQIRELKTAISDLEQVSMTAFLEA